jgi:hypothetical protein
MSTHYVNLKLTLVAALLVAALIAGWVVLTETPTSSQTPTPEEKLAEKIRHFNAVKNQPPQMTQAEIDAKRDRHLANYETFKAKRAAWLEEFEASGPDLRSLPWQDMEVDALPGPSTLDEAVRSSKVIVSGVATSIDFNFDGPFPQAILQFKVDETYAGSPAETIEVSFIGGPSQRQSGEVIMLYDAPSPLLLPSDRAILLIHAGASRAPVRAWGVVKIEGGLVRMPRSRGVPSTQAFNNVPLADFVAQLKEAIARNWA